jgi:predicted transcriptional regulator
MLHDSYYIISGKDKMIDTIKKIKMVARSSERQEGKNGVTHCGPVKLFCLIA